MGAGDPQWRRIADDLAERIRSGVCPVDSYLPSHTVTAQAWDVDRNTARRAANHLRNVGLIEPVSGKGLRVIAVPGPDLSTAPDSLAQLRADFEAYRAHTTTLLADLHSEISMLKRGCTHTP